MLNGCRGFTAAVKQLFAEDREATGDDVTLPRILPDGWEIDHDERVVRIYEEVNQNPIRLAKLAKIIDLWWYLDYIEWCLECFTTTAWGGFSRVPLEWFVYEDFNYLLDVYKWDMTLGSFVREQKKIIGTQPWKRTMSQTLKGVTVVSNHQTVQSIQDQTQ
ncbi:MAG TPA: hypothetical protein VMW79_07940 [Anaerolineae bacterium]|nr:hypothetical protein [Anaerolineae bacterium]